MTLAEIVEEATRPDTRGRPISQFNFWEGRRLDILYRGGWNFVLASERTSGEDEEIQGEYAVPSIDEAAMEPYLPPTDLVLTFAALAEQGELAGPTSDTEQLMHDDAGALVEFLLPTFSSDRGHAPRSPRPPVHSFAMRSFLEKWGPLDINPNSIWANSFSQPAATLAEALELAALADVGGENREAATRAFRIISQLHAESSSGSLLRVLALQALAYLFRGAVPRRCPGCGTFFTETTTRGANFRRRDATYCSTTCRNRVNKRRSRERARKERSDGN